MLGCLSPGPGGVHSTRLFAESDTAAVDVDFIFLSPKTSLLDHEQTNKMTRTPSPDPISNKEACFDLHERDLFLLEKSI